MNYTVTFTLDDEPKSENLEADNPGTAFALCLKKYPEAKLTAAEVEGKYGFHIEYQPPPVQRAPSHIQTGPRKSRKNEPYGSFPF